MKTSSLIKLCNALSKDQSSPTYDLMLEHSILRRIVLVFTECKKRLEISGEDLADTLYKSATIIRDFIEDHHEKLEEKYIFPAFKDHKLFDLVKVLTKQHKVGRKYTDTILKLANKKDIQVQDNKVKIMGALCSFIKMYAMHGNIEDTVLFVEYKKITPPDVFSSLGEKFEALEYNKFGSKGDLSLLKEIEKLEKSVGLNDLDIFE